MSPLAVILQSTCTSDGAYWPSRLTPKTMLGSSTTQLDPTFIHGDRATLCLNCCGIVVAINAPEIFLDQVPGSLFPDAEAVNSEPQITFTVCVSDVFTIVENGRTVSVSLTLENAIQALEGLMHETIAASATERAFVHAGVVGFHGKAIVIPGRSHAGKTTLVMALVEAGATYYSDEYALLDAEGFVHAFQRAPRVRHATGRYLVTINNDLPPLPAGLVIMSAYKPNALWMPKPLSARECLFGLIDNAVGIRSYPELYLSRLKQIALNANAFSSARGEASQVANAILTELLTN